MVQLRVNAGSNTVYEEIPDSDEALTADMTRDIMNCGFTPTFDRFIGGGGNCGVAKARRRNWVKHLRTRGSFYQLPECTCFAPASMFFVESPVPSTVLVA